VRLNGPGSRPARQPGGATDSPRPNRRKLTWAAAAAASSVLIEPIEDLASVEVWPLLSWCLSPMLLIGPRQPFGDNLDLRAEPTNASILPAKCSPYQ
jgi:hypothetical protein